MVMKGVGYVVKIGEVKPIPGYDRIVATEIQGLQVIVPVTVKPGDRGIFFYHGTVLTPEFCYENNLNSNPELNKDKTVKGYICSERKVKTMTLKGNHSMGMFKPFSAFEYTGANFSNYKTGTQITSLNMIPITVPRRKKKKHGTRGVKTVQGLTGKRLCDLSRKEFEKYKPEFIQRDFPHNDVYELNLVGRKAWIKKAESPDGYSKPGIIKNVILKDGEFIFTIELKAGGIRDLKSSQFHLKHGDKI